MISTLSKLSTGDPTLDSFPASLAIDAACDRVPTGPLQLQSKLYAVCYLGQCWESRQHWNVRSRSRWFLSTMIMSMITSSKGHHLLVNLNGKMYKAMYHFETLCRDWMQKYMGQSGVALLPTNVQQASLSYVMLAF